MRIEEREKNRRRIFREKMISVYAYNRFKTLGNSWRLVERKLLFPRILAHGGGEPRINQHHPVKKNYGTQVVVVGLAGRGWKK